LKIAERLRDSLPLMREWVEATLGAYADRAVPVLDEGFERLASVFPRALLRRAKAVVLEGKVPFPPLGSMGLPELAPMERMPIAGITYDNTFFVSRFHRTESLYFHEMVHVVQWPWTVPWKRLPMSSRGTLTGACAPETSWNGSRPKRTRFGKMSPRFFRRRGLFEVTVQLRRRGPVLPPQRIHLRPA